MTRLRIAVVSRRARWRSIGRRIGPSTSSNFPHRDRRSVDRCRPPIDRHGLRASEVVVLRWDDIDLTTGRLHVRRLSHCGALKLLTPVTRTTEAPLGRTQKRGSRARTRLLGFCEALPRPKTKRL